MRHAAKTPYANTEPLLPEDVAESYVAERTCSCPLCASHASDVARVYWVATLPPRVNINRLEMMPVYQSFAPLAIHRTPSSS